MKNTGSRVFSEAYFIVNSDSEKCGYKKGDMISEANRIIEEGFGIKKRNIKKDILLPLASFLLGGAVVSLLFLIF